MVYSASQLILLFNELPQSKRMIVLEWTMYEKCPDV